MPGSWKVAMVVLVACLVASMAIAVYRLATTPTEVLGGDFRVPESKVRQFERESR